MLVPDSVRVTILARLRLMNRMERRVVGCASAIGCGFGLDVLSATVTCSRAQARTALERAQMLELVVAEPHAERFTFRHALIRDVIYGELITTRTRLLHRRIARALERVGAERDAHLSDLAYHSWAAGDVRRGIRYNELAGDRAAALHALDDAGMHFTRARGLVAVGSHAHGRLSKKLRALDRARLAVGDDVPV